MPDPTAPLRTSNGQFAPTFCPDPNCGGALVRDVEQSWRDGPSRPILRCDGLTHMTDDGPLIACAYQIAANAGSPNHA